MADYVNPDLLAAAKLTGWSAAGAFIYHRFRPARNWAELAFSASSCVLMGLIFTHPVMRFFTLDPAYVGAVGATLGLFGQALVAGALKGIERFDFRNLVPGGGSAAEPSAKDEA